MAITITFDANVPDWERKVAAADIAVLNRDVVNPVDATVNFKYAPLDNPKDTAENNPTIIHVSFERYRQAIEENGSALAKYELSILPPGDPFPQGPGGDTMTLTTSLAAMLGIVHPHGTLNSGSITLNSDNSYVQDPANGGHGVDAAAEIMHEATEELLGRYGITGKLDADGRATYAPLDLYRFDAEGEHSYIRKPGNYFSVTGQSVIDYFNNQAGQDGGDWSFTAPHAVKGDSFGSASPDVYSALTPGDVTAMRATGATVRGDVVRDYDALPHGMIQGDDAPFTLPVPAPPPFVFTPGGEAALHGFLHGHETCAPAHDMTPLVQALHDGTLGPAFVAAALHHENAATASGAALCVPDPSSPFAAPARYQR